MGVLYITFGRILSEVSDEGITWVRHELPKFTGNMNSLAGGECTIAKVSF